MLTITLAIARNTFVESVRQPMYFILVAICGLAQILTTASAGFSMGYSDSSEVSGDNKLLLDLCLATVFVCGMLLAAFLATSVISKEIERKTVLTVVSKPVPRPLVVIGKYLGVASAITIAVVTMLGFVQLFVRHGVLSTAADKVDMPVVVFGLGAVLIAVGVGVWCNFFYGWVFSQTTTLLLCPLILIAWVLLLVVNKDWRIQELSHDFKPQILLASLAILLGQLVMTAVAVAASARLGQVMTIVVCFGVFVSGLVSNYMFGRHAVVNQNIGRLLDAKAVLPSRPNLEVNGDQYLITFEQSPKVPVNPGSPIYYGSDPGGLFLATTSFEPFQGNIDDLSAKADRGKPAALVVVSAGTGADKNLYTIEHVGADDPVVKRLPRKGDYVFSKPTAYSPIFFAAWVQMPNIQYFWMTDAVTQNQPIPMSHIGLLVLYTVCLIGAFLSLAVVLFQKREVG